MLLAYVAEQLDENARVRCPSEKSLALFKHIGYEKGDQGEQ